MARFNPKKVVPTVDAQPSVEVEVQESTDEAHITNLPDEAEGEGYKADFARFLERGFI